MGLALLCPLCYTLIMRCIAPRKEINMARKKRVWKTQTSKSHNVSIRIPLDLYGRLTAYCDANSTSITAVICSTLRDHLDAEDERQTTLEGGTGFIF